MTPRFRTPSCTVAAGRLRPLALVSVFLLSVVLALAAPVKFDIPAQPAPAALQLFMTQSGASVMYSADQLGKVRTAEVKGELEPLAALQQLLAGTDFNVRQEGPTSFVIEPVTTKPGSVEGSVQSESGRPVAGARVTLVGSNQTVLTDKRGRFIFEEVPAGPQSLAITAEGMQNTKVTDVNVKAGYRLTLSTIAIPVAVVGAVQLEDYIVSAKKNDGVVELDPYAVKGSREKPFVSGNMDVPRTVNDAQPYYIFNAKAIAQSGATNVEDLLKQRLTMDTNLMSTGQTNNNGTISIINLRGLGGRQTLVLVNGRRMAAVENYLGTWQADLNGIPLSAVDRIEVLPSSASAIYGGGAVGGVVNVILKRDYSGGLATVTYENTWDSDAPIRTLGFTYGRTLEGGRTHVFVAGQYADAQSLLQQDRRTIFERGVRLLLQNYRPVLASVYNPFEGATPNVASASYGADYRPENLTLKDGTPLGSPITYVPAGIRPTTPQATLNAALVANAGNYNYDLPSMNQSGALGYSLGAVPRTKALQASVRHEILPYLEIFVEGSHSSNHSIASGNPFGTAKVLASSPANPFEQDVYVNFPSDVGAQFVTTSLSRSLTVGLLARLPAGWTGELDYTWSGNTYDASVADKDWVYGNAFEGNPFVDTAQNPIDLSGLLASFRSRTGSTLNDIALRAAGPLWEIGNDRVAFLTIGLERRHERRPDGSYTMTYPVTTSDNYRSTFFARGQQTGSAYTELKVPFITPSQNIAIVHSLELNVAARSEQYRVSTGTDSLFEYYNFQPPVRYWSPFTPPDEVPYRSVAKYTSTNPTVALKYQPVHGVTLRTSYAKAFLPPTSDQLLPDPSPSSFPTTIRDPKLDASYDISTITGGNPTLVPQNSKSWNAGIIWEPEGALKGLRLNLEYFQIDQLDLIGSLSAQSIVDGEAEFPGRVTRDGNGRITVVNTQLLNLTREKTSGWDLSVNYRRSTRLGTFDFFAVGTRVTHDYRQNFPGGAFADYAGWVQHSAPVRTKGNVTLNWEFGGLLLGWTTRYVSSYPVNGTSGDPSGYIEPYYSLLQGADHIPAQTYHDAFVSFAFGRKAAGGRLAGLPSRMRGGLTVEAGIKNVFNTLPPFDANTGYGRYSMFGDIRLRTYRLSVRKQF